MPLRTATEAATGARPSQRFVHRLVSLQLCCLLLTTLLLSSFITTRAATLPSGFTETLIANGLTNPTAMAFAPDGRIFVCLQGGQLRVIKNNSLLPTPFVSLTVDSAGERGLLGIAFDPNFTTNQYIYLYYTATTPATHNRVSRFTANGDVALAGSEQVILDLNNLSSATNHNGGAMHFGPDGKLYIAVGENANSANSQSFSNLLGKMLRINPTPGSLIPYDNPYANDPNVTGNNKAIWALGLRNPYTFAFQSGTGRMFINDVGQNTYEEIDEGVAGSNYGWPNCEGFVCGSTAPPNYRAPLYVYAHSTGTPTGCAITGGVFYNPQIVQFPGNYIGKYFFADYCSGFIRHVDSSATPPFSSSTGFATGIPSPVDLQVGPDGCLYYLARGSSSVFRIQSTSRQIADFDGDGKTDTSVYRPDEGNWYVLNSGNSTNRVQQWGAGNDRIVPGDYDGDRKTDFAVFRASEGNWYIIQSSTGTGVLQAWGQTGDIPVPGDYDADGKTDIAIYRPSEGNWYVRRSTGGVTLQQWGASNDKPVVGDYDGDGKTDFAIFRPGEGAWYLRLSAGGVTIQGWGLGSDAPVPGDYDGDGKTDTAVFRPSDGNWYVRQSSGGSTVRNWGQNGDVPVPGDYDGDRKIDFAVFRPQEGNWYIILSGTGSVSLRNLGQSGDRPVPSALLPD